VHNRFGEGELAAFVALIYFFVAFFCVSFLSFLKILAYHFLYTIAGFVVSRFR